MIVHVGLHVRMCRAICTYVCDGVKIRVEKGLCQGPEKGGETLFFCPKEREFSFGGNSNFLRTKQSFSSDKILALPKGARIGL